MSTPKRHPLSITSAEFDARRPSEGRPTDAREGETHRKRARVDYAWTRKERDRQTRTQTG